MGARAHRPTGAIWLIPGLHPDIADIALLQVPFWIWTVLGRRKKTVGIHGTDKAHIVIVDALHILVQFPRHRTNTPQLHIVVSSLASVRTVCIPDRLKLLKNLWGADATGPRKRLLRREADIVNRIVDSQRLFPINSPNPSLPSAHFCLFPHNHVGHGRISINPPQGLHRHPRSQRDRSRGQGLGEIHAKQPERGALAYFERGRADG